MKEQNEEKNLEVSGLVAKTEEYIEKNKKMISIVGACVVVVALAIFAYVKFVSQPRQLRAAEDMFAAEQWFNEGDFEKALNGNDQFMGFLGVIDEYHCTKSANLAKYYAGICQLNLGQFDEAIKSLKSYKGKDVFTTAEALMLIGDAYAEQENATEACNYYEKAASSANNNFIIAPTALWKAGMMQLKLGNKANAVKSFQKIKDNYPESPEFGEVDKYIAFAEAE
ncbi:MAG: tetratricopeptide repeat protein [Bacteroidales bacterium]|nr:tetratricopeptide repeat protein [Bacteroidales bacterium]